jgi:hypothetical protein
MFIHAQYLQTIESFLAFDPWGGRKEVLFSLEDYVMVAAWDPDDPLPPDSFRAKMMDHRFAIRNVADGEPKFLPDSLVSLWRAGQVPLQELPLLLAGLQPTLQKNSDYYESSFTFIRRWGNRLVGGFAAAGLLYWLGTIVLSRNYADLKDWVGVALIPVVMCVPIELFYLRQVRRRAAQKRWVLGQVTATPGSAKSR